MKQVKEVQTKFRKASDDYDYALSKHISASKTKPTECEEAANHMLAAKSKFTTSSLEYTDTVNWELLYILVVDGSEVGLNHLDYSARDSSLGLANLGQ